MDATIASWMPESRTVPEAIARWAAATPDAAALFGIRDDCISHAQVQTRIEDIARQLSALEVMRGDRVVLALPNGVEGTIAGIATLRTAVGVPVNPSKPLAEADSILVTVSPRVVIVAQGAET